MENMRKVTKKWILWLLVCALILTQMNWPTRQVAASENAVGEAVTQEESPEKTEKSKETSEATTETEKEENKASEETTAKKEDTSETTTAKKEETSETMTAKKEETTEQKEEVSEKTTEKKEVSSAEETSEEKTDVIIEVSGAGAKISGAKIASDDEDEEGKEGEDKKEDGKEESKDPEEGSDPDPDEEEKKKLEEADQYRVTIKAQEEDGTLIDGIEVEMFRVASVYEIDRCTPDDPLDSTVYTLNKKRSDGWGLRYYFTVKKSGYTGYQSSEFTFDDGTFCSWHLNANTTERFFTITITLENKSVTLAKKKEEAKQILSSYKDPNDYLEAEQQEIERIITTYTSYIETTEIIGNVDAFLTEAKKEMDKLTTKQEYENIEYRSNIYFQHDNGDITNIKKSGEITLSNIDSGYFHIKDEDGNVLPNDEVNVKWISTYTYNPVDHPESTAFYLPIASGGRYQPDLMGSFDVKVYVGKLGREISFRLNISSAGITALRATIDGNTLASGETIYVKGSEPKVATIEGRIGTTERWVSIPSTTLLYSPGISTSVNNVTGQFRVWGEEGSITYTLNADRSVSTTVKIKATIVKPTSVTVTVPERATVGDWNGAFDQYVGLMEGSGYRVSVYPSNTSNPGVTWEDLTPDIATFQEKHALGIVPKKAGLAKFRVSCNADPSVNTTVQILFQYEKPLKTAEAEKNTYYAKTSDKSISLTIITNGEKDSAKGASEQRFDWSYSKAGVVKVTDAVHYDKSSVTIPNWFSHTITILGEGTVYVTGTPWDNTENCKPVTFKVVVSSDIDQDKAAAERVEQLILGIGKVTLAKKTKIQNARAAFQALTTTQKMLVDDDIYAILVAAEAELRRLEQQSNQEDEQEDEKEVGDGNGQGNGSGDETGNGTGGFGVPGGTGEDGSNMTGGGTGGNETGTGGAGDAPGQSGNGSADAAQGADAKTTNAANSRVTANSRLSNRTGTKPSGQEGGSSGSLFREINIEKNLKEVLDEINPLTKVVLVVGILLALFLGVERRRKKYLMEEKNIYDEYEE